VVLTLADCEIEAGHTELGVARRLSKLLIHTVTMAAEGRKLKVLLIGPAKVGKTTIANFLSEHTDTLRAKDEYTPTVALRCVCSCFFASHSGCQLCPSGCWLWVWLTKASCVCCWRQGGGV